MPAPAETRTAAASRPQPVRAGRSSPVRGRGAAPPPAAAPAAPAAGAAPPAGATTGGIALPLRVTTPGRVAVQEAVPLALTVVGMEMTWPPSTCKMHWTEPGAVPGGIGIVTTVPAVDT